MNDIRAMLFGFTGMNINLHRTDRDFQQLNGMSMKRDVRNVRYRSPRRLFIKEAELMSFIPACETA
jgi:hypothetical protein